MGKEILSVLLLLLMITTVTLQDGFNFYKALNRTPISRVERFYRDGLHRPFKVPLPLTKRLLYDGLVSENEENGMNRKDEEILSILMKWLPSKFKSNDAELNERKLVKCIDTETLLSSLE